MFDINLNKFFKTDINQYLFGDTNEQKYSSFLEDKFKYNNIIIRPDKINNLMDEKNIPFWLKAGLINKINIELSTFNKNIPKELFFEGIYIILCPSYKYIYKNLKYTINKKKIIDLDLNNKDNIKFKFDTSIFNKPKIDEIYIDQSLISKILNIILNYLFDFFKIIDHSNKSIMQKILIRIEDDELVNYEGDFILNLKINNIISKMCNDKNTFEINNLSIYWEKESKIIISNYFFIKSMIKQNMNEYYKKIKEINFILLYNNLNNLKNDNIKLIIDNFSITVNYGIKKNELSQVDKSNIQNNQKRCYFQISSNELKINIYPEFIKTLIHFIDFINNFFVIEKIIEYRPNEKPFNKKNLYENQKSKEIARNWLHYIWKYKMQKKREKQNENPFRTEFKRFYIIHEKITNLEFFKKINENSNVNINKKKDIDKKKDINNDIYKNTKEKKDIKYTKIINNNKYLNFSLSIKILIKGFIISIYENIKEENSINVNASDINIKFDISHQKFLFILGIKKLDIGPKKIIIGERVILNPANIRSELSIQNNNNHHHIKNISSSTIKKVVKINNIKYEKNIIEYKDNKEGEISNEYNENSKVLKTFSPLNIKVIKNYNFNKTANKYKNISRRGIFMKNLINSLNNKDLIIKEMKLKEDKELSISKAVNNYNHIKNMQNIQLNNEKIYRYNTERNKIIHNTELNINNNNKNNISSLNLIEIYSNSEKNAFIINYIKNNNSFSLDDISIKLGIIRLHPFYRYLIDMASIYKIYQNIQKNYQIFKRELKGKEQAKYLLKMRQYLYKILSNIQKTQNTELIISYSNYLNNEIEKIFRFRENIEAEPNFDLNYYLFSNFPKGIKFYFEQENIECICYNKEQKMIGKFQISPSIINISISLNKIIADFFGINAELNSLNEIKFIIGSLIEEIKNKIKRVKLFIKPCYKDVKDELTNEGMFDDEFFRNIN